MVPPDIASPKNCDNKVPKQSQVRSIKSQQASTSKEIKKIIQGIQDCHTGGGSSPQANRLVDTARSPEVQTVSGDPPSPALAIAPSARVCLRSSVSFMQTGLRLAIELTLNKKQRVAFLLIYRQLDQIWPSKSRAQKGQQHFQFIRGKGGTGKSRVIEALITLFKERGILSKILVTATSGTTAARIGGITIHSACNIIIDPKSHTGIPREINSVQMANTNKRFVSSSARIT